MFEGGRLRDFCLMLSQLADDDCRLSKLTFSWQKALNPKFSLAQPSTHPSHQTSQPSTHPPPIILHQGFASGDSSADAWALRHFVKSDEFKDNSFLVLAQSFAKNFGLYGERVGTLSVVCPNKEAAERVRSQLKLIIRPM
jgi:hypothetical protein